MHDMPKRRASRLPAIGFALLAVLLALAVVAGVLYLFAPGALEKIGLLRRATPVAETTQPTPTTPIVSDTPGTPSTVTPGPVPTVEPTPSASPIAAAEIDELLTQAEALAERSKFEDAIRVYQYLAGAAPADARPEIGWAWALILDNQPREALAHARSAADLDANSAAAATVLARTYLDTGGATLALVEAQRAVGLEGGNATAHAVLAECYLKNGQPQKAADEADLALVLDINDVEARRIRGWLYSRVDDDMGRAVGELQAAAGIQPELWLRRHELGLVLLEAQNYSTAILAFQDALALRPKAVTFTAIGEAYYQAGQYDQARVALLQAIAAGADDPTTFAYLGATYAHLGRCNDAKAEANKALALNATHSLAREVLEMCAGGTATPAPTSEPMATTTTPGVTPTATKAPPPPAALRGWIAFPVWNDKTGKYDTYVAQAQDGSQRRLVIEQMHQPAFSPDGNWLALNGELPDHVNLHIIRPDGSGLQEITPFNEDGQPYWSPESKGLVIGSNRHGDKKWRIYIIDDVPFEGGKVEGRSLNYGPDDVRGRLPAWTADGQIVYQGCDRKSPAGECLGLGLYIMTSLPGPHDPQQLTKHASDTTPAVFQSKITFMSDRDGDWEIYVMNIDGSDLKQVTANSVQDGLPTWSPDGRTVAFVSNQGNAWAVWAIRPDGTNRRKLFDIGGGGLPSAWQQERISWAP